MRISSLGEFGLIEKIRKSSECSSPAVVLGIGDDAAVMKMAASSLLLATTDLLIEHVHFDLAFTDFPSLGWKSAAVNLSDIAAMGGIPRFCLSSIAIPSGISLEAVSGFYRGFSSLLRFHNTILVGGDTSSSKNGFVVSVTVLGESKKENVISRSGAKQGDRVFVTGTLGDSGAGLEILKSGHLGRGADIKNLIKRHIRPVPRIEWGRQIALAKCASSMIDISDGLSSDLSHICDASGVGAVLFSDKIPLSKSLIKTAKQLDENPLHYALSSGEDYELLFTVPSARMKTLESLRIPVTEIGKITKESNLHLVSATGRKTVLKPTGYNHFKGSMDRKKG